MGAVLRCKESFNAWGCSYNVGDEVHPEDWPEEYADEAVANRLNNGFLFYDTGSGKRKGKAAAAEDDEADSGKKTSPAKPAGAKKAET